MKLRTDLLAKLLPEDVMESVKTHNHRYKAEPLFSKTGTGSLSSASTSERGRAQHGINSETHQSCATRWEEQRQQEMTLAETFALLRSMHRSPPFLSFNGNTFAEMGRQLSTVLFADLRPLLLREISSAAAYFIAIPGGILLGVGIYLVFWTDHSFWGSGACAIGAFAVFEAIKGWCAIRALGIGTPF